MNQDAQSIEAAQFARFQALFYRQTGIVFGNTKRYFVDRRLQERMAATRSDTFEAYLNLLQQDTTHELQNLVNAMTVNETYFDRESYQFRCLINDLLPELVRGRRRDDPLRIWSIPCSTGEEPYSIAIHLLDAWAAVDDWDVRLLASDIDTQVIERARAGIYDSRALQHVPQRRRNRFFTPVGHDRWQVVQALRNSVEFRLANLSNAADMHFYHDIDVIFCRNLLIYFDDESRRRAIETLYGALRPGGFICLGHSESMNRMSDLFIPRKFPDALVHQKPPLPPPARGRP